MLASKGWLLSTAPAARSPSVPLAVLTQHCSWLTAHCLPLLRSRQAALSDGVLPRPSLPIYSLRYPVVHRGTLHIFVPETDGCSLEQQAAFFPCPDSTGSSALTSSSSSCLANLLGTFFPPKLRSIVVGKASSWSV